jgi:DNA-binding LacI/PurR family transcriptional regulator
MPVSLIRPFPAVNQASHVSAKTREKVEAAMAQLNYYSQPRGTTTGGQTVVADWRCYSSLALHAPSQIVAAIKSRADQLVPAVVYGRTKRVEACKAAVHNLSRNASVV